MVRDRRFEFKLSSCLNRRRHEINPFGLSLIGEKEARAPRVNEIPVSTNNHDHGIIYFELEYVGLLVRPGE